MTYDDLLEKLIGLRKNRGYSQGDLADRMRVKRAIIGHREQRRSQSPLDELGAWAEACGAELRVELVTDRRELASSRLVRQIQRLDGERAEVVALMLRVLPHLDARDLRSVRLLLDAHERELSKSQRVTR